MIKFGHVRTPDGAPGAPGTQRWESGVLAASFPRRAAGLLAAGSVGLSVAVLGTPGIAQAAYDIDVTGAVDRTVTIPSTVCAVRWDIGGGRGGNTLGSGGY